MGMKDDEVELFLRTPHNATRLSRKWYFLVGVVVGLITSFSAFAGVYLVFFDQVNSQFQSCSSQDHNSVTKTPVIDVASSQCDISKGSDRSDCWPEYRDATQSSCEARGCCWSPGVEQGAPYCYYPRNFDRSYMLTFSQKTSTGVIGHLERTTKSPYPNDSMTLQLEISEETSDRLHIKIYDPSTSRYEVPIELNKEQSGGGSYEEFDIKLARNPFGIIIRRMSTGQILFDTTGVSPLIFADQYLQIGTALTTSNVYGFGEHRSGFKLDTNWKKMVFWNRDQPPEPNLNLYGAHPLYLNMDEQHNAHGVFLLNSNAMEVDFQPFNGTGAVTYRALGGILDFYIFLGPTPDKVVQQYTSLVGRPYLPPFWSLGFQMCKYGYNSAEELKKVIARNRAAKMPYDVQWNDIDYMKDHLDWTYDNMTYPGLPDIVADLHNNSQRYVIIVDPGISVTQQPGTYPSYDEGIKDDIFVKADNGSNLVGKVWPGLTVFPDFFHPNSSAWWYRQAKMYHDQVPYDGLWVDMNEPSNFVTGSITGCTSNSLDNPPFVPPTIDGSSLMAGTLCPSAKHSLSTHYNLHNMYGLSEMKVTSSVLKKLLNKRSIVLSRSTYPSAGVYGSHWLGDNLSSWVDLYYSIPGILNFQMFGIPFVGVDICGFRGDTNAELCTRWMQVGAFYPFMRNHNSGKKDQDPASFDANTQAIMRSVLETRYRLLPLLYTLLYRSHVDGGPVARPLLFQYPEAVAVDKQFLWGSALLISPVLEQGAVTVQAYIPGDVWYDYYNMSQVSTVGQSVLLDAPIDKINLHVRGGSVIPTKPAAVTTDQMRGEMFALLVALDGNGTASGEVFWDDGETLDTVENNQYSLVTFSVQSNTLSNRVVASNYTHGVETSLSGVTVLGVPAKPGSVTVNGKGAAFTYDDKSRVLTIASLTVDLLQPLSIKW
ncbi:lysosomal alpha-glucosidase-like [Haliotis rufescens]|uniref:lysosomal alpha-glucosidase-like n=1 Tax=Haliotis rufescens TaxID=6454 RepID=UPI00201EF989|nr:lysosomal alpha-glucosidase-like [Haliotis rufescens]